jgi:hypothetical protein
VVGICPWEFSRVAHDRSKKSNDLRIFEVRLQSKSMQLGDFQQRAWQLCWPYRMNMREVKCLLCLFAHRQALMVTLALDVLLLSARTSLS